MEHENVEATAPKNSKLQSLATPIAIIIGFGLIAAAIFFSGNQVDVPGGNNNPEGVKVVDTNTPGTGTVNPVTDKDHIKGNPDAPIVIVEYSDFDCPYCKIFHETMNRIVDEYGPTGEVAWVYRHFPLQSLHQNAPLIAEASECVAAQGGDEAFWSFADSIFGEREINSATDLNRLPEFAADAGVDVAAYEACVEEQELRANVEEDFNNAVSIGGKGTPYSVILVGDQAFPLNGARPYDEVKSAVESLLEQIEASSDTE